MSIDQEARVAHWQRVKAMLAELLEHPAHEREAALDALAGDDADLRAELRSLLTAAQADEEALHRLPSRLVVQAVRARLGTEPPNEHRDGTDAGLLAGHRVGPWRLTALIARGGQGEVYRAERADGQFDQQVAIKLLSANPHGDGLTSRFAAERQLLAGLDHPNLARLLDGGTTDEGVPYFVMELVEGEPIDRYCTSRSLALRERLKLFRTVCQVVGYAHSKAIVHRDLKCDNVLVTPEGVVKLVDFGIAKQLGNTAQITATAQRMMTLAYSSPEQVRGEPITPASDVYSLGVVLYRLLTDTSPYEGVGADSSYQLTRAICDTEPVRPSRVQGGTAPVLTRAQRRRLRGDLDAVVMMALRKDPARRYADANALGEDIFRHLESLPVRARRGALSYKFNRFVVRHRAVFATAMLANVALLIGLGGAVYQSIEAKRQQRRAEQHLASVREIANVLIFDVYQAIADLPGSTAARKLIVDRAISYLNRITADAPDDTASVFELAHAHRRLAEVQNNTFSANLGDLAGARENAEKALQLCRRALAAVSPNDPALPAMETETIRVLLLLSALDRASRNAAAARARLDEALELSAKPLARGAPGDDAAIEIASLYVRRSELHVMDPDARASLEWLDKSEAMIGPVVAAQPANLVALRVNALVHLYRGNLYAMRDRSRGGEEARQALVAFDGAQPILNRMLELKPESTRVLRDLAAVDMSRGLLLARLAKLPEATAAMERGRAALARIAQADPANYNARTDVAAADSNLGLVLLKLGDVKSALERLGASTSFFEKALADGRLDESRQVVMIETQIGRANALRQSAAGLGGSQRAAMLSEACALAQKSKAALQTFSASRPGIAENLAEAEAASRHCP